MSYQQAYITMPEREKQSPTGENPREETTYYVKLEGHEYDVLVAAYSHFGGDETNLAPLDSPALGHNNGISQLVRAIVRREVTADDSRNRRDSTKKFHHVLVRFVAEVSE